MNRWRIISRSESYHSHLHNLSLNRIMVIKVVIMAVMAVMAVMVIKVVIMAGMAVIMVVIMAVMVLKAVIMVVMVITGRTPSKIQLGKKNANCALSSLTLMRLTES